MLNRVKVLDLELTKPIRTIEGLSGYSRAQLLLRWHKRPIGYLNVPVRGDRCEASEIANRVVEEQGGEVVNKVVLHSLLFGAMDTSDLSELLEIGPAHCSARLPTVSVAVCTRDRTDDLAVCLEALRKLEYPALEILVVDNAPSSTKTRELVEKQFPEVRYVLEPRPGLDWARSRAISEARGTVIAYTDDDVVVDPYWTKALAKVFAENSDVMAVTGLVVPYELETDAQVLFEEYGGFGRGFDRKWYRATASERYHIAREHGGAGKFGTGANMAFRRSVFAEIGMFDPALDVGTPTQGGGDLEMFFRVLKHGHALIYEPAAMVRHRHRRDLPRLHTQLANNGVGFYAHLVRGAKIYPEERKGFFKLGLWWFWHWNVRRWIKSFLKPGLLPRQLVWAELRGCFVGLFRYEKAREKVNSIVERFGPLFLVIEDSLERSTTLKALRYGMAIRRLDLSQPLPVFANVAEYFRTRIFVTFNGAAIGKIDITNRYRSITPARLADELVGQLGMHLLGSGKRESAEAVAINALATLRSYLHASVPQTRLALPEEVSVSIVVATCDRPEELRQCLASLTAQITRRQVEIVVVDNRPESGLTAAVVAEFPNVRLIEETRGGLSYARNAGFAASSGDILICTDDDVIAPSDWLENLVAPFSRNDVMVVTGNVFPAELETASQIEFEAYGGLGRGFERKEYNREWFDSFRRKAVPTWEIGATANAAIRAEMLCDPGVGLLDEALGAGTPTGCSEDTYLFYRVLKTGYTIVYEPGAYVWHQHRANDRALRRQIFNYSKGHVAYHLMTFLREGDSRGLVRVFAELPLHHMRQFGLALRGKAPLPLSIILLEIAGNLAGPFALWRSRRRVRSLGFSLPYIPVFLRVLAEAREQLLRQGELQPAMRTVSE